MLENYHQALTVISKKSPFDGLTSHRRKRFMEWLPDNMLVVLAAQDMAFNVMARGRDHYSIRTIWEVLRWYSDTSDTEVEYKLGDAAMPFVGRLIMAANPELEGMFMTRSAVPDIRLAALDKAREIYIS